jgi:hypothetical protein
MLVGRRYVGQSFGGTKGRPESMMKEEDMRGTGKKEGKISDVL